jgi:hypothetical protein
VERKSSPEKKMAKKACGKLHGISIARMHTMNIANRIRKRVLAVFDALSKPMKILRVVKAISLILLAISFAMPLSRCNDQYIYAWHSAALWGDLLSFGGGVAHVLGFIVDLLLVSVFFWPIPFLVCFLTSRKTGPNIWRLLPEVLLSASSIFLVYLLTWGVQLCYGGYLAYCSLGFYMIASLIELGINCLKVIEKSRFSSRSESP